MKSKWVRLFAPPALALVGMGCATSRPVVVSPDQLAINPADIPGSRPDIFLTGRLEGVLHSDGLCITVRRADGMVTPLWPGGTEIVVKGGQASLHLPDGRGVAKFGDRVSLSGGALQTEEEVGLAQHVRENCPRRYFAVGAVISPLPPRG